MYLKCHTRTKDGKQHRYWSIAEKRRGVGGKRFDRHVLYLGEINDREREAWAQRIAVFDEQEGHMRQLALFPVNVSFGVLLYDLTSTYFESEPIFPEEDQRKFGYSRDHRPDCVPVVVALVVTPEGFPTGFEVMPGNTADGTTLRMFLDKVESL
jgi:hypothetical protein